MPKAKFIWHRKKVKLQLDDIPLFERLRLQFSIDNKASDFSEFAAESKSCMSVLGSFQSGLIYDIRDELIRICPDIEIEYDSDVLNAAKPLSAYQNEFEMPTIEGIQDRDYQKEDVRLALSFGRGIIESPTGTGKSYIIYSICWNLLKMKCDPILILVPTLQLVRQMQSDFIKFGMDEDEVQAFSSFAKKPNWKKAKVIIINSQWMLGHSKEIPDVKSFICDETHILKADNNITDLVKKIPTFVRFGFTGTLPEDIMDIWSVKGVIGPLLSTSRAYEYQADGTLADIKIVSIRFKQHRSQPYTDDHNKRFYEEWKAIEKCKKSNSIIADLAMKSKGNSIILFDHTEHGQELFRICSMTALDTDKEVRFIDGSIELDDRTAICEDIETKQNIVLVANAKCFGVGINIKNISSIILALSGKGQTKIIQAIGRGLRQLAGKTFLTLFDIHHSWKYSSDHFIQRLALYKEHYAKNTVDITKEVECL